jgi:hypothetical protein
MNRNAIKFFLNFDKKTITLMKIGAITVFTVYGGHRLVQFVSPTKEELLEVIQKVSQSYLILYLKRNFQKNEGIII